MSTRDDKKTPTPARVMGTEDPNQVGAPIPSERYRGSAERAAQAEDRDAEQVKATEEPGPDFRVAAPKESEEEHRFTTDSPRWGDEGTSREVRGYPREGDEAERRVSDAPPERNINPRK